jgi:hypothetical protein
MLCQSRVKGIVGFGILVQVDGELYKALLSADAVLSAVFQTSLVRTKYISL